MKKLLLLAIVVLVSGLVSKVSAQLVTDNNTASGEIIAPIQLEAQVPLEFGKIATLDAGTVTLTAAAAPVVNTSDNEKVSLVVGTTRTAAKYKVDGAVDFLYTIGLPDDDDVTLNGSVSGTMTVTSFTCKSVNNGSTTGGKLTGGTDIFYVGGTLNVGDDQPVGTYSGSFNVTVIYN